MKKHLKYLFFSALLITGTFSLSPAAPVPTGPPAPEVLVSAAISLKDVMAAITPDFEKANTGIKLAFNFGASGQLKIQIENGAPADAFLSAARADTDSLERKGFLVPGTRQIIAKNTLVLIRNKSKKLSPTSFTRIAIGNPATVPAGRYAKETLEKRKLFEKLKSKLILTENVRQVLDYVARGEVDAGYVYMTDAMIEPKVEVVERIPSDQHSPILYPAAVLKDGKNTQGAKRFVDFLMTAEARKAFKKYGFE